MSVNYKALGGLFTFRYINDVEDLDLDDLQEMYADVEDKFHVIEKDYNIRKKLMILLLPAPLAPNKMLTSPSFKVTGLSKAIDL